MILIIIVVISAMTFIIFKNYLDKETLKIESYILVMCTV